MTRALHAPAEMQRAGFGTLHFRDVFFPTHMSPEKMNSNKKGSVKAEPFLYGTKGTWTCAQIMPSSSMGRWIRRTAAKSDEVESVILSQFPCSEHVLRQICGFAGLYILLSFISGTPLSSLVGRKLQRSTRRRGERNLPALRSTPLRAGIFFFQPSAAAHDADLPCSY